MRVVYYSQTCFLDNVLHQVKSLSQLAELSLFVELSPEIWSSSIFEAPDTLPSGVIPADSVFESCFPPNVKKYWQDCANIFLVVHNCRRTVHPGTWCVSHQAARIIRSLKPDILHFNNVTTRMTSAISEVKDIPIVLTIHDPQLHSGEPNWRSVFARWFTFRQTNRWILHSRILEASLASRYGISPSQIDVVPLGVYDIFREWDKPDDRSGDNAATVLFFGRLSTYKGLEVLYEAASTVAEKVPDTRFVVAGRPVPGYRPPPPPPLPNNATIVVKDEYITNMQLAGLFREASVVVCPYIDATQSGVVLTAYAFDKPVVASNTGGLPEYVKHGTTGFLVPPKDARSLADALVTVLTDGETRHRLEDGVRTIRDGELSWESIAKQLLEVYGRTLEA